MKEVKKVITRGKKIVLLLFFSIQKVFGYLTNFAYTNGY